MSSSDQALVTIGQQNGLAVPSSSVDFGSKFLKLKPATVVIVQQMSDVVADGVAPGKIRISETGDLYEEMEVALLAMPKEGRDYHINPKGTPKSKDTLLCFSRDMIRPSKFSKVAQSELCSMCKHSSWDKYNETKSLDDIPACDASYYVPLIDTQFKMPLQTWIRGANKKAFDAGLENVSRTLYKMKIQGLNPQIYDVRFTLGTKKAKNGKNFVFTITNAKPITAEERVEFGEIYQNFVGRSQEIVAQAEAEQAEAASRTVNAEILEDSPNALDSDYVVEL